MIFKKVRSAIVNVGRSILISLSKFIERTGNYKLSKKWTSLMLIYAVSFCNNKQVLETDLERKRQQYELEQYVQIFDSEEVNNLELLEEIKKY